MAAQRAQGATLPLRLCFWHRATLRPPLSHSPLTQYSIPLCHHVLCPVPPRLQPEGRGFHTAAWASQRSPGGSGEEEGASEGIDPDVKYTPAQTSSVGACKWRMRDTAAAISEGRGDFMQMQWC